MSFFIAFSFFKYIIQRIILYSTSNISSTNERRLKVKWEDVALEEYKTLRNESLQSMVTQQSVLRFGIAALAILIATSFNIWEEPHLPETILFTIIPLMSYLILLIWFGELARMVRASRYLINVEKKINNELQNKYIFSLNPNYKQSLTEGNINRELSMLFDNNNCYISNDSIFTKINEEYLKIRNPNGPEYIIHDYNSQLNVYQNNFPYRPNALTWENWLREPKNGHGTNQMRWNYYGIVGLFFLIALSSIVIGTWKIWSLEKEGKAICIFILELIILLGFSGFIYKIGKGFE